ncbi:MAG: type II secretion system F family protein [Microbacteriaceae bacterium]
MAELLNFNYRARNSKNDVIKGSLEASSSAQVLSKLRAQGLVPISVTEKSDSFWERDIQIGGTGIKPDELAVTIRQLSVMVANGIPLLRALSVVSEQSENKVLSSSLDRVRLAVETGISFSTALSRQPKIYPPLMVQLVKVGEAGGFLDTALISISDNLEADLKLRDKIKSAMTYPIVVLIVALLGGLLILTFVVPQFEGMYAGLGGELPVPTQVLVVLSRTAIYWVPTSFAVIVGGIFWYRRNKDREPVRKVVDTIKLRVPVFGKLFNKVAIARFSRSMALLLRAGVPILQSISLVKKVSNNWQIEQALDRVEESVSNGRSFAAPLLQDKTFPPMLSRMVAVGEDSGSMDAMLESLAEFYDREVETTADQLTALIEPLLVVFIGLVIGGMVISLYLPMFGIFELIR